MTTHEHDSSPDAASAAHEYHLPIDGFEGSPEEIERQWYLQCYQGRGDSMLQLTWRAVLMGSVLGGVLSLTNIYIGLKAGWAFGVAITACILSYAIWTSFYRVGLVRTKMTILENNCMQSTASSAGYSTGGTLVSAFSAYLMLGNPDLSIPIMMGWVFFLAVLGVTMAIPMKRQMINVEQLRFPTGIAAAETLNALHSTGTQGMRSARALAIAGVLAAINQFWLAGLALIDKWSGTALDASSLSLSRWINAFNEKVFTQTWMNRTVDFLWDPIFLAAGALAGFRVCASMILGAVTCWMIFVPAIQDHGLAGEGYRELIQWTLWGGVSCMVTSGLLAFAMQWKSAMRAFRSFGRMFARGSTSDDPIQAELDAIETPASWFVAGQLVSLIGLAWLAHLTFGMPVWQSTLAVILSFALSLVACRVTGETDTTPVGAMGKITQLIFGGLSPARTPAPVDVTNAMNVNLMAANITAGAAGSAADLLTDLKSGYLLGAHPRKQFIAQFAGIFAGTLVTVLAFKVIIPNPTVLGSDQFPAPSAQAWKAVAEAMSVGIQNLEPLKVWSICIGGGVGLLLPLLGVILPKQQKYMPSPAAIGLA